MSEQDKTIPAKRPASTRKTPVRATPKTSADENAAPGAPAADAAQAASGGELAKADARPLVNVCTDGACLGNPGPGGWGAILSSQGKTKEMSGGYRLTTNNRMEMLALIMALEELKEPCEVVATTDSKYLHDAIVKGWLKGWQKRGWVTAEKKPVKNQDLWRRLDKQLKVHRLTFQWVRGHAGHAENERCDALASQAARRRDLSADPGYPG